MLVRIYQPMSPFHARTTKFCTDLPANSWKVLNTSMTPPTQPLDPRVPQTLKPKWVTGEKTLCNLKCPDGWRKLIKFFPGSAEARMASISYKGMPCYPVRYIFLCIYQTILALTLLQIKQWQGKADQRPNILWEHGARVLRLGYPGWDVKGTWLRLSVQSPAMPAILQPQIAKNQRGTLSHGNSNLKWP